MGDLLQPWHLIVLFGFFVPLYFMPGIVSRVRHCKAHNGILVVNLFLGWTFIGWVVALAWAASGERDVPLPAPKATL